MKVHANAALGPAGRIALCEAIELGMTWRPLLRTGGGIASRPRASQSYAREAGFVIAPHGLTASHAGSHQSRRSRFCVRVARPDSGVDDSRGSCAAHAQRAGRCSTGTGSHDVRQHPGKAATATSGLVLALSCTSIRARWRVSKALATECWVARPTAAKTAPSSATRSCTPVLMIIPATPTSSSI